MSGMRFDFETMLERHGMDAVAVDGIGSGFAPGAPKPGFDAIPMWVADMNFATCPTIPEEIVRRAQHPAFGYFRPTDAYFDSVIRWQETRNGVTGLEKKHIGYENGVLGGVISALNTICSRGDAVLLHSPTYIGFTHALENNGYRLVLSALKPDADGVWRMDWDDMERKLREEHIHAMVFCSPHNPCGRVWEQAELERLSALCERYQVTVVSDEIWSDIILDGHRHIPTQSATDYLHENTAALYAPSKTFNLAGLVGSYHIIYNKRLRERVRKESSLSSYNNMNVLSMHALIGAYTEEGAAWTDQLREAIGANADLAEKRLRAVDGIRLIRPQGTYMLFPDCGEWCRKNGKTMDELERACWDVGVALQDGRMFHGQTHLRINLAIPARFVDEAFDRLEKYVF
jgi:cystathionine beta-lyase